MFCLTAESVINLDILQYIFLVIFWGSHHTGNVLMPVVYLAVLLFIYIQLVLGNIQKLYQDFKLKLPGPEIIDFQDTGS